jgi:peptidoglycan hydrolase CwlO-like protein
LEKLLADKLKEYKEKEAEQINRAKDEYEIKIKAFKEKYKQLEVNEFAFLENEYNRNKEKLQIEYNSKITTLENKLKSKQDLLDKQVRAQKITFIVAP